MEDKARGTMSLGILRLAFAWLLCGVYEGENKTDLPLIENSMFSDV